MNIKSSVWNISNLTKRTQLQISDQHEDILQYGTACSDSISELECFRNICTPIFIFLAAGYEASSYYPYV